MLVINPGQAFPGMTYHHFGNGSGTRRADKLRPDSAAEVVENPRFNFGATLHHRRIEQRFRFGKPVDRAFCRGHREQIVTTFEPGQGFQKAIALLGRGTWCSVPDLNVPEEWSTASCRGQIPSIVASATSAFRWPVSIRSPTRGP